MYHSSEFWTENSRSETTDKKTHDRNFSYVSRNVDNNIIPFTFFVYRNIVQHSVRSSFTLCFFFCWVSDGGYVLNGSQCHVNIIKAIMWHQMSSSWFWIFEFWLCRWLLFIESDFIHLFTLLSHFLPCCFNGRCGFIH